MTKWIPNRSFTNIRCSECGYITPTNPIAIRGNVISYECPVCEKRRLEREKKEFLDKSEGFVEVPKATTRAKRSSKTKSIKTETGE